MRHNSIWNAIWCLISPSWYYSLYLTCYFFFFFSFAWYLHFCHFWWDHLKKIELDWQSFYVVVGFLHVFNRSQVPFFLPRQWSNQYYLILIAVYSFLSSLNSLYILLLKNKLQYFSSPTEAMSIILRQSDRRLQRLHSTHKFAKLFCFWFIWCWSLPHRYDHILIIYAALWE